VTTLISPVAQRVAGTFSRTVCTVSVVVIKDLDRTSLVLPLSDVVLAVLEHAVEGTSSLTRSWTLWCGGWGDCEQVGADCV